MRISHLASIPFVQAGFIIISSFGLALIFDFLFYGKIPGISFPLYLLFLVGELFAMSRFFKQPIKKEVIWMLVPLFFFSAMVFIRSSGLLTFLNIVICLFLLLTMAKSLFEKKIKEFVVGDYLKTCFIPFKWILPFFQTSTDLLSLRGVDKDRKKIAQVVTGIAFTVPVLLVFLFLFSSADLIFEKFLSRLIDIDLTPQTIVRAIFVFLIMCVLIGAYTYVFQKKEEGKTTEEKKKRFNLGSIESSILFGSVNVLFVIFIIVQLAYLFGGENNISLQGFTYAEYARRGFFELIAVGVVSFVLLLIADAHLTKDEAGHMRGFKWLSTSLIVEVLFIIISAFIRLSLYEDAYGFTTFRLFAHLFILWMAGLFFLLLYKVHKDHKDNHFAFSACMCALLFLGGINILNPDAFVARQNIERYALTGKLDAPYLSQLSDDAVPYTITILNSSDEELKNTFMLSIYGRAHRTQLKSSYVSKWQSWNFSRMRAKNIFASHINELESYRNSFK
ncbi:MAG: hypothetical protein UU48_C0002G0018 [Candidatus Uhrbacteria bacterium GW2011_GWF2_41_16]|uniref:Uncharacterized protein n=2 Tax=Candidatus Uhriibacteriota TaxID=1752732 RepID=A0A0G0VC05_9BACT|nr:MAG: hypothetical protein UU31_C0003G0026 [Candidatus Uhrbacteria bacterium GW2011_GWA2_41_10]KKR87503.1 MAG: hypothetical protein UU35_C0002G0004 [Candidatus Uhrbacteria bacterium GW2011_GWC2_41_11]KKR98483.1 MAG: hypothetical protein UU48_C0002G0018 [Candidatus Uhrbacteria bacterium GW2011_GWF2_41_16]HBO99982.1 hypothetical protein [Candidatus Uhrbacteria bacterium]